MSENTIVKNAAIHLYTHKQQVWKKIKDIG